MEENTYHITLPKLDLSTADAKAKELLERAKKENGMIPNMFAFMAHNTALLETYMFGYERYRKDSGLSPAEQEVVLLTISLENDCDYCIGGHAIAADLMSKVPVEVTNALLANKEIPDARLQALSIFTSAMINKRGNPSGEDVAAFLKAGFIEKDILAVVLGIGIKTISNYNNHLFQTPGEAIFKTRDWAAYKVMRKVVNFFKK